MKKNKAYQANLIEPARSPSEEVLRYVEKQDLTPVYAPREYLDGLMKSTVGQGTR
jgi:hypothetical protein